MLAWIAPTMAFVTGAVLSWLITRWIERRRSDSEYYRITSRPQWEPEPVTENFHAYDKSDAAEPLTVRAIVRRIEADSETTCELQAIRSTAGRHHECEGTT